MQGGRSLGWAGPWGTSCGGMASLVWASPEVIGSDKGLALVSVVGQGLAGYWGLFLVPLTIPASVEVNGLTA